MILIGEVRLGGLGGDSVCGFVIVFVVFAVRPECEFFVVGFESHMNTMSFTQHFVPSLDV